MKKINILIRVIKCIFIEGFDKSDCNNKADICDIFQIIYTPEDLYNEENTMTVIIYLYKH